MELDTLKTFSMIIGLTFLGVMVPGTIILQLLTPITLVEIMLVWAGIIVVLVWAIIIAVGIVYIIER